MIGRLREKGIGVVWSGWDAGYCIAEVSACADFSFLRCLSSAIMSLWGFGPDDDLSGCLYAEKRGRHHRLLLRPSGHVALPNPFRRATQKPTLVYVIDAIAVCLHEQISTDKYRSLHNPKDIYRRYCLRMDFRNCHISDNLRQSADKRFQKNVCQPTRIAHDRASAERSAWQSYTFICIWQTFS